jgi:hypothetical protein
LYSSGPIHSGLMGSWPKLAIALLVSPDHLLSGQVRWVLCGPPSEN